MSFEVPYLEKHRPLWLDDIIGQDGIISATKNLLTNINEFPHILAYGPPGIGKTTYVEALAREIYKEYGDNAWEEIVLEINASEERKLDVVRDQILTHCRTMLPRFDVKRKMVILEEFDSFLGQSQHALRRPMEQYAPSTIFLLTANYQRKIISPIRSRCMPFAFKKPRPEHIAEYLKRVAIKENVAIEKSALSLIANNSGGDFRPALLIFQSSIDDVGGKRAILEKRVLEVHNFLTEESIVGILGLVEKKKVKEASELTEQYLISGVSPELILTSLYEGAKKRDLFAAKNGVLLLREFVEASKYVDNAVIPEAIFDSLYMSLAEVG